MTQTLTLGALLPEHLLPSAIANLAVGDLRLDSRLINCGDIFVCVNAAEYIPNAIKAGAVAVLVDDQLIPTLNYVNGSPIIPVKNLAANNANLALRRYTIAASLDVVGVTGTNGKSTLVSLIAQLFKKAAAKTTATIGTLGVGVYCEPNTTLVNTGMTTPDIFTNYKTMADFSAQGVELVAMEVSSHGLNQGRVQGLPISTAVFTNLSQDHLDYHGTLAAYAAAKKQLFDMPSVNTAIINADDAHSVFMVAENTVLKVWRYGVLAHSDVCARDIIARANGTTFTLVTPWGQALVNSPLLGVFNIYNLLAAITVVLTQGVLFSRVVAAIAQLQPVRGRMQLLPAVAGVQVIVDFAHTPDGLEQALLALKEHTVGRIWVVFGCGGDRDKQKRALMGAIAEDIADEVIITSDNPRSEEPLAIIEDIAAGCKKAAYQIIDRQIAIAFAIAQAQAGDCVLIAGKGHETYQQIKSQKIPFCDATVALDCLQKKKTAKEHF